MMKNHYIAPGLRTRDIQYEKMFLYSGLEDLANNDLVNEDLDGDN